MGIKIWIHFAVFILFFWGIFRYFLWKSKKCENKECECPIKDNMPQGYLVVGTLSVIALLLLIIIELYIK